MQRLKSVVHHHPSQPDDDLWSDRRARTESSSTEASKGLTTGQGSHFKGSKSAEKRTSAALYTRQARQRDSVTANDEYTAYPDGPVTTDGVRVSQRDQETVYRLESMPRTSRETAVDQSSAVDDATSTPEKNGRPARWRSSRIGTPRYHPKLQHDSRKSPPPLRSSRNRKLGVHNEKGAAVAAAAAAYRTDNHASKKRTKQEQVSGSKAEPGSRGVPRKDSSILGRGMHRGPDTETAEPSTDGQYVVGYKPIGERKWKRFFFKQKPTEAESVEDNEWAADELNNNPSERGSEREKPSEKGSEEDKPSERSPEGGKVYISEPIASKPAPEQQTIIPESLLTQKTVIPESEPGEKQYSEQPVLQEDGILRDRGIVEPRVVEQEYEQRVPVKIAETPPPQKEQEVPRKGQQYFVPPEEPEPEQPEQPEIEQSESEKYEPEQREPEQQDPEQQELEQQEPEQLESEQLEPEIPSSMVVEPEEPGLVPAQQPAQTQVEVAAATAAAGTGAGAGVSAAQPDTTAEQQAHEKKLSRGERRRAAKEDKAREKQLIKEDKEREKEMKEQVKRSRKQAKAEEKERKKREKKMEKVEELRRKEHPEQHRAQEDGNRNGNEQVTNGKDGKKGKQKGQGRQDSGVGGGGLFRFLSRSSKGEKKGETAAEDGAGTRV